MDLASRIGAILLENQATLSTAESCTGGLVANLLTNVPGSSGWYVGGVVAYSNRLKQSLLGVQEETLRQVGAVSPEVAVQMALGARRSLEADYAISVTGVAGPGGGSPEKPTGLVYVAVATPEEQQVQRFIFNGSREANKQSSAEAVLSLLLARLEGMQVAASLEGVSVDAAFDPDGTIHPVAFTWNGRPMKIAGYGRKWEEEGKRYFLVMTAENQLWQLCFEPSRVRWSVTPRSDQRWMV